MTRRAASVRHRGILTHPAVSNRRTREAGVESLQMAIIGPVLILIAMAILQASLYAITSMQASSAAQTGAQAARAQNGTLAAGTAAATSAIQRIGIARSVSVGGSRTATDATITVTATTPSLVPGLQLPPVVASAHGPVERVTQ